MQMQSERSKCHSISSHISTFVQWEFLICIAFTFPFLHLRSLSATYRTSHPCVVGNRGFSMHFSVYYNSETKRNREAKGKMVFECKKCYSNAKNSIQMEKMLLKYIKWYSNAKNIIQMQWMLLKCKKCHADANKNACKCKKIWRKCKNALKMQKKKTCDASAKIDSHYHPWYHITDLGQL